MLLIGKDHRQLQLLVKGGLDAVLGGEGLQWL